jgi:hypothetical protein
MWDIGWLWQFKGFPALPVYVALSFLVSRANVRYVKLEFSS